MRINAKKINYQRLAAISGVVIFVAQVCLTFASWFIGSIFSSLPIRSMLNTEGIRWIMAHSLESLVSPVLATLLLITIAYGTFKQSGLYYAVCHITKLEYRRRFAIQLVALEFIVFTISLLLLIFSPDAPLLSITGKLFPSSFSQSIIPLGSFSIIIFSVSYGIMSSKLTTLVQISHCLTYGIKKYAILYVLCLETIYLYESVCYVFF